MKKENKSIAKEIENKIKKMDSLFKSKASSPQETIEGIKQNKNRAYSKSPYKSPLTVRRPNGSVDYDCPSCLEHGQEEPFEIVEKIRDSPFACYWKCNKCGSEGFHTDIGDKPFERTANNRYLR